VSERKNCGGGCHHGASHEGAGSSGEPAERRLNEMSVRLRVWRQKSADDKGGFEEYDAPRLTKDMSFLEMLDVVNEDLQRQGDEPIAFDSDCREGICGTCSLVIDGVAHGHGRGTTTCQIYMRSFKNGATITIEPWRAKSFPVVRDLIVDRSAFDRIIASGGYNSVNTGSAADANATLVSQARSEEAFDAAACIGCGACVATCKNASAMLFVSAKVKHLNTLPQGQPERRERTVAMLKMMDDEGFGHCTNEFECEAVCPKEISVEHIAFLNREYLRSRLIATGLRPVVTEE
jgi:succinate dehydrogenase / fumarate reductase iron-sulfur subunit